MLSPIKICWATTSTPAGLSGSITGTDLMNGRIAQVSASTSINRTRRGIIRAPKIGATVTNAATRASGHRKLPTQAAISALFNTTALIPSVAACSTGSVVHGRAHRHLLASD